MKRHIILSALLLASLVAFGLRMGTTQAKTVGAYDITWHVIASGGTNTGGAYTRNSTIGQSHTSAASGGAYTVANGFWPSAPRRPLYLPLIRR